MEGDGRWPQTAGQAEQTCRTHSHLRVWMKKDPVKVLSSWCQHKNHIQNFWNGQLDLIYHQKTAEILQRCQRNKNVVFQHWTAASLFHSSATCPLERVWCWSQKSIVKNKQACCSETKLGSPPRMSGDKLNLLELACWCNSTLIKFYSVRSGCWAHGGRIIVSS